VTPPGTPGDRLDAQIDAELEFHRTETIEALVARGWTEQAARAEADLRFGDQRRYRRQLARVERRGAWSLGAALRGLGGACTDALRATTRLTKSSPGFAATALVTLALGTGANTAVFSVVDAVLLRPLPYAQPDRLVTVGDDRGTGWSDSIAPANLEDYRAARSLEGIAAYTRNSVSLTKSGSPEQVLGEVVTWNLFDVLGVPPAIGRAFTPDEDRPGGAHVVILTHGFFATHFGGDSAVVGRTILLNDVPHVVVGVMPDGFEPLSQPASGFTINFFVPLAMPPELLANRRDLRLSAVGRLAPGVTLAQARADLGRISGELATRFPDTNRGVTAAITPLREGFVRDVRLSLVVLLGAVGLVLLIACVNLANLLFVRAIGQRREIAIRMAIGASRNRVVLDFAMRGVWLGVIGGSAGVLCGIWIRDWLVALAPASVPVLQPIALNLRVLAVTAGAAIVTGGVAGLVPALQLWREDAAPTLKASALSTAGARTVARWRGLLTAAEIAAALMLTVGAALLVRSLVHLMNIDLGFQTSHVVTFAVRLPPSRYHDKAAHLAFFEDLERRVRAIPGVEAAAFADVFPMRGGGRTGITLEGRAESDGAADFQAVNPGFFPTVGIPLVRGRLLDGGDRLGAPDAAVVSETFVRRWLRTGDPIGRSFRTQESPRPVTIVGVVGDVRREGKQDAIRPQVFVPAAQIDSYTMPVAEFAARASGDPHGIVPAIQRAVESIDPDQPIRHVQTFDEMVSRQMAARRFNMLLLGGLAALAVGLALVGVYGVVAHAAAQRSREIGIRIALGASRRHVIALVSGTTLKWALAGSAAGLAGAYLASGAMGALLFDIPPADPIAFVVGAVLTAGVAGAASYLPAGRAASTNPVTVLRQE